MAIALVTGGTGFVGSHIVRQLVDAGHRVRVYHRPTSSRTALDGLGFESAMGELDDENALATACTGVDWLFHVAAVADYWRADADRMKRVNVDGTRHVLSAARQAGVRRVIFTSSAAAVGIQDDRPANEHDPFNLPPHHFPYGHSKWMAEAIVGHAVANGQEVVTLNPVVIMGPGDLNMISGTFMTQIKRFGPLVPVTNGGVAVVDVRDVARWHIQAATDATPGERYILGTANYTYRQWFDMIAEAVGGLRPRLFTPDFLAPIAANLIDVARRLNLPTIIDSAQARLGIRHVYFDFSKAWNTLGPPQISMKQSLQDTHAWYMAHGYL